MKVPRRQFLRLAGGAVALPTVSGLARAQAYPARPVRIIVGFAAGGLNDIIARLVGQWLSERLGKPFITENRPGSGGNIAVEAVVNAPPDGYTLLMVSTPNAVNATSDTPIRNITPVAGIMRMPNVMTVSPSLSVKTVPEFIAYAKARPGKVSMGSAGVAIHLAGELFKMMTGVNMTHVPHRASAAMFVGLFAGQTQVAFDTLPPSIEYIRTKKLRALAVTTGKRSDALPEVPTIGDFVPGYEASAWFGVGAPRDTPAEIIDVLNKEINAGLVHPILKARFSDLGGSAFSSSPAEFGKFIADEMEKWAKVVKFAGMKPG